MPQDSFAVGPTIGPNINLSRAAGNQYETSVAINPNNNPIFVVGRNELGGLATARSSDGGVTWTRNIIGTANPAAPGNMPRAYGNASVAWDSFGNVFLAFLLQSNVSDHRRQHRWRYEYLRADWCRTSDYRSA